MVLESQILAILSHEISLPVFFDELPFFDYGGTQNTDKSIEKIAILIQLQKPGTERTLCISMKRAGHYLIQIHTPTEKNSCFFV